MRVVAVNRSPRHRFSKTNEPLITLLPGLGVEGDAHAGATVRHRYDRRRDPTKPNLRQVHLLPAELLEELRLRGLSVGPGGMGENVLTEGVGLVALPTGTRLRLGREAVVELTGLRAPCVLMNRFREGLMAAVTARDGSGATAPKAGVMGIVRLGGTVRADDPIEVELPEGPHRPLRPV